MDARSDPGKAGTTAIADREIFAERLLDAPRDLVFKVWTDTRHLEQWWGPIGFTTTTRRADIRSGGQWRFVMHGPDGTDYENIITFVAVEAPARLAYNHRGDGETRDVTFEAEVTFAAEGARTRLTMRMRFPSNEARDLVIEKHGALEGLRDHVARLCDHLALQDAFLIARTFEAPLDLVWRAHTEVEHLRQWWGPKGFAVHHATLDLRPGGIFHYGMRTPGGQEMWGRFVYREIIPQRRIVWVNSFSDAEGGLTRHPASPDWPLEMLVMASFAAQGGVTTLTLRSAPVNASDDERRVFKEGYKSMEGGFGGTFDQLAAYLRTAGN